MLEPRPILGHYRRPARRWRLIRFEELPAHAFPCATKVLVIGYVWPEPRSSAASGHVMQILETFLGQGWDITFSSPAGPGEQRADLLALGIREVPIELNDSSFDAFISTLAPDIVLFDQFMMEEQFGWRVEKHCPGALRVLETSDLQSLRHARHQRLKDRLKRDESCQDFSDLFAPPWARSSSGWPTPTWPSGKSRHCIAATST